MRARLSFPRLIAHRSAHLSIQFFSVFFVSFVLFVVNHDDAVLTPCTALAVPFPNSFPLSVPHAACIISRTLSHNLDPISAQPQRTSHTLARTFRFSRFSSSHRRACGAIFSGARERKSREFAVPHALRTLAHMRPNPARTPERLSHVGAPNLRASLIARAPFSEHVHLAHTIFAKTARNPDTRTARSRLSFGSNVHPAVGGAIPRRTSTRMCFFLEV